MEKSERDIRRLTSPLYAATAAAVTCGIACHPSIFHKKGGTVTVTQTHVVSSDGKTDTITNTSTNAEGKTVTSVRVYDKQ